MIKGVNKQVLEVSNPESPYFDRVLFFVSADGSSADGEKLKNEANKIVSSAQKPPRTRRSKKDVFVGGALAACGVGAGAALALALSVII